MLNVCLDKTYIMLQRFPGNTEKEPWGLLTANKKAMFLFSHHCYSQIICGNIMLIFNSFFAATLPFVHFVVLFLYSIIKLCVKCSKTLWCLKVWGVKMATWPCCHSCYFITVWSLIKLSHFFGSTTQTAHYFFFDYYK